MRRRRPTSTWIPDAGRALPRAEAGELARRAAAGDAAARWEWTRSVAPLVRKVAGRVARRFGRGRLSWELADAGITEVWQRCHLYDPERGSPGVFAERVAWHGFREVLGELGYPVRLPSWVLEPKGVKARQSGAETWHRATTAMASPESIGIRPAALDVMPEDDTDPAEAIDLADFVRRLCGLRKFLTPRERRVLAMRFRLGRTLGEVGAWMGVTAERVRQIEAGALGKLRKAMGGVSP